MPRLVPEVVVVFQAARLAIPTARDLELIIQQQETAGHIARRVPQHREHDRAIGQTVYRVRSIRLVLAAICSGSITLYILRSRRIGGVDYVIRPDFKPGTIGSRRMCIGSAWQLLQAFQPKWCSSSPACGIANRLTTLE